MLQKNELVLQISEITLPLFSFIASIYFALSLWQGLYLSSDFLRNNQRSDWLETTCQRKAYLLNQSKNRNQPSCLRKVGKEVLEFCSLLAPSFGLCWPGLCLLLSCLPNGAWITFLTKELSSLFPPQTYSYSSSE